MIEHNRQPSICSQAALRWLPLVASSLCHKGREVGHLLRREVGNERGDERYKSIGIIMTVTSRSIDSSATSTERATQQLNV